MTTMISTVQFLKIHTYYAPLCLSVVVCGHFRIDR